MTGSLLAASITPFDSQGRNVESDQRIVFDFNPESLQIQASAGEESDRGRQGRQQVQHVARTHATLTFDAVFDTTRPNPQRQGPRSGAQEESLDVRHKTAALGALVRDEPSRRNRAPRRIQFRWGSIVFNGVMTSFSETLDYFSPGGVPLRSKVSITITEQEFRYEVEPSPEQPVRRADMARDAAAVGRQNDAGDLDELLQGAGFDLAGGIDAELSASLDLELGLEASLDLELGASLGLDADFDLDLRAGVELGVSAAVGAFGTGAVLGAAAAAGGAARAAGRIEVAAEARRSASKPPSAWAPRGLAEGSGAVEVARAVVEARARGAADRGKPAGFQAGTDVTAPRPLAGARAPQPLRGAPPLRSPAFGPAEARLYAADRRGGGAAGALAGRRPSWERLEVAETASAAGGCACCGAAGTACGCGRAR